MPHSIEKCKAIYDYVEAHGKAKAIKHFGIAESSIKRSVRKYKEEIRSGVSGEEAWSKSMQKIKEIYTPKEIEAIASGGRIVPGLTKVPVINFEGKRIRLGVISDTHIGSLYTDPDRIFQAFEEFKKEKVDFITHSGDVVEGMSNRQGHIYELSHLGYDNQKKEAKRIFSQWSDTPMYFIDGNHDRWFEKSNGALIVKDIADAIPNMEFIGHDEGDISLKDGKATLKLWHGGDGNSYALSYRLQKILESLSGGEKPDAMICGHTHKFVHIFERNVHTISAGSIQRQTSWMRGKRIAAHVGFCIVDIWVNDDGISKFSNIWYPFYT
jgi:predicted phosphodiesterase